MKNKMLDLNNHLFAQLERLNDETLKGKRLDAEIRRSDAVIKVSKEIVSVGALMLKARVAVGESIPGTIKIPDILD